MRAPKPKIVRPRAPWELPAGFPQDWSPEIVAMQALQQGTADTYQQRTAWRFIVDVLCRTDEMSFQPGGLEADRAASFAEGARYVGRQMRKIARLQPKGVDPRGEPPQMPAAVQPGDA